MSRTIETDKSVSKVEQIRSKFRLLLDRTNKENPRPQDVEALADLLNRHGCLASPRPLMLAKPERTKVRFLRTLKKRARVSKAKSLHIIRGKLLKIENFKLNNLISSVNVKNERRMAAKTVIMEYLLR